MALTPATLAFDPASPTPVTDGVLFSVTGPVRPRGKIVLKDSSGRVRAVSPEFGQKNHLAGTPDQDVFAYAITGSPSGGTFKLQLSSSLESKVFAQTGAIAHDANDAAVKAALEAVSGVGTVTVTSGVIYFDSRPIKGLSLALSANTLSGGSNPTVSITKKTAEAAGLTEVDGGPYYWGPIYLPALTNAPAGNFIADVVATLDDADIPIYEGDSMLTAPVTVYDYPA